MSLISKVFRRSSSSARMARRRPSRLPLGGESLEGRLLLAATPTPWSTASRRVVPAAPTVALMSDTGSSAVDRITRVGTLAITGAITGARVGYSIDGGRTWATSFTAKAGVNNVMVRQTSTAGANSPATAFSFTLDNMAPAAPRVALQSDTGASASDRITSVGTLAVTGLETGARTEYSINSGSTWATSFAAKAGLNSVAVRQADVAGNVSPTATLQFTLDSTAPAAPKVALQADTGVSTTDRITRVGGLTVSGTEAGAAVQYSLDAGKTWAAAFSAVEGKNTLQVRQVDGAGNTSAATPFEFTRLSAAPIIETMTFNRTTRTATVVFNRPVTGVTVGDFWISGATGGFAFDFQATNPQLAPHVGAVSVSGSGRTWNLMLAKVPLQQSGSYAITLVAANSGIVDEAGNALMADKWTFLTT
jgi:hypothetical protein